MIQQQCLDTCTATSVQTSALNVVANGVVITDRKGIITWVNPAFTKLTGFVAEEVVGQHTRILKSGQHDATFYRTLWATISAGQVWHGELVNRRKDGSLYTEEMTITPVLDDQGRVCHYIAIKQDVSDRRRAAEMLAERAAALQWANDALRSAHQETEAARHDLETTVLELAEANDELGRRNAELDEYSYIASHDLQEPLRKLVAFSDLLRRDLGEGLPPQAARDLDFITDAAKRMQTLVQDLLRLSRLGRAALRWESVPLDRCVDQALAALATRVDESQAKIVRQPLPQIHADAMLMTQLYQNLIGNALKFMPPGQTPEIQLTCERVEDEWVLGVKDNGIGIKAEHVEQIFLPFKRLHGRGEYEGTGIGLAMCRKAVDLHGGRLWVESQPGAGAHFKFTIEDESEAEACCLDVVTQQSCS